MMMLQKLKVKRILLLALGAILICTVLLSVQINSNEKSDHDHAHHEHNEHDENGNHDKNKFDGDEHDFKERINLNELFHYGQCLIEKSGERIVDIRLKNELDVKTKNKDKDASIVTQADLVSHKILVNSLQYKYKNLKVISEENTDDDDDDSSQEESKHYINSCSPYTMTVNDIYFPINEVNVWIDPLDATLEYSENLVEYVNVMFCITVNGKSRAGIIHNPFKKQTDWSMFTNTNSLYVNRTSAANEPILKPKIIVSRSHTGNVKDFIEKRFNNNSEILIAAGSGYKSMSVARNTADLYLHTSNIYKWDLCAPNAIINSLGGKMTDINGNEINYTHTEPKLVDGVVAAITNFDYFLKTILNSKSDNNSL